MPVLQLGETRGVLLPQPEDIAGTADHAFVPEFPDDLLAQALDIEGVAADEVAQPLDRLGVADQAAGAAPDHLALRPDGGAAADRAVVGEPVGLRFGWSFVLHDLDDLRNHVAGPLDDDQIADSDTLADDLVLVVQGGA